MYEEPETLTTAGRKWAEKHAWQSMMASVALSGTSTGWPATHVAAAIKVCNEEAAKGES